MEQNSAPGINQDGIQNLTFVHSLYSQNQLSDPLLRDADNLWSPLGSDGFCLYREEASGSGYDADDSGDSPTVFSHTLPEQFGPLASSVTSQCSAGLSESNKTCSEDNHSFSKRQSLSAGDIRLQGISSSTAACSCPKDVSCIV